MRHLLITLLVIFLSGPVAAQDRTTIGWARLFTNDLLGDGEDRWRTGGYSISHVRGQGWDGSRPRSFGEIIEYRLRSEIIAPASLSRPAPNDRRYAGILSFGLHTHYALANYDVSAGFDFVGLGRQTGMGAFQREIHETFSLTTPRILDDQLPNAIYPTVSGELARPVRLSQSVTVRPFVSVQVGAEDVLRVGGDLVYGSVGHRDLLIRETITGHLMRATAVDQGFSFVIGADLSHVSDSNFLPDGGSAVLKNTQARARIGVHWQGQQRAVFYGLTWLGEEFESQSEPQVVGSIRVNFRF